MAAALAAITVLAAPACSRDDRRAAKPVRHTSSPSPVAAASPDATATSTGPAAGERRDPVLLIESPREGETVEIPVAVRYQATPFRQGMSLVLTAGGGPPKRAQLTGASGEVFFEGIPEGTHDLHFELAGAEGQAPKVVVSRVTTMTRGAGGGGMGAG
ncbi:MAG TPA: hypothetical protein VNE62_09550 [Actinomycetota bacterium]|nr:hypothetical protein [Actinomycetota bacterium]